MESPLIAFEKYITSLTNLGVFPIFQRHSNGWSCVLRNAANKQLMPFQLGEFCWGETIMDALTVAVTGLNQTFRDPKELHKYIDTGINKSDESLQTLNNADVY
jgi:hypothetical protein